MLGVAKFWGTWSHSGGSDHTYQEEPKLERFTGSSAKAESQQAKLRRCLGAQRRGWKGEGVEAGMEGAAPPGRGGSSCVAEG